MYDARMRSCTSPPATLLSLARLFWFGTCLCACGASATEAMLSDQLPPKREAPADSERYELTGVTTQVNVDISGLVSYTMTFPEVAGELHVVADAPDQSVATVIINMKSGTTSNKEYERIAKSKDFLDVQQFPTATFDVRSLTKKPEANSYDMVAVLDLHGTQKALTVPFRFRVDACTTVATTTFSIDRRKFGVSSDGLFDSMASDNLDIRVQLQVPRSTAPATCTPNR